MGHHPSSSPVHHQCLPGPPFSPFSDFKVEFEETPASSLVYSPSTLAFQSPPFTCSNGDFLGPLPLYRNGPVGVLTPLPLLTSLLPHPHTESPPFGLSTPVISPSRGPELTGPYHFPSCPLPNPSVPKEGPESLKHYGHPAGPPPPPILLQIYASGPHMHPPGPTCVSVRLP